MTDPLDPQLLLEVTRRAKRQLRRRAKEVRTNYPRSGLAKRSELIVARLVELPELETARALALFYPLLERGEVDLRPFDEHLRGRGIAVYYPFMTPRESGGYSTGFRPTRSLADLEERGRGFLEPPPTAPIARPGDLDWVVVPALAADARGHRLGYGSGFYDATLADVAPPAQTAIVVYDFQLLAEVPTEAHDVPCNLVVSDARTLRGA